MRDAKAVWKLRCMTCNALNTPNRMSTSTMQYSATTRRSSGSPSRHIRNISG